MRATPYLLPPLLLAAWAYWPIIGNYFHGDDFQHLYLAADGRLGEFLVTPHGGHMLVARNALFAASYALFGVDPRGYFWLALITHLVNVGLLLAVVRTLTASLPLAAAVAALWGVSVLNVEALGWYSVYGQVALTTVMLLVLGRLARAARDDAPLSRTAAVSCYLLILVGTTCFGTGIGFALALALAASVWLPGDAHRFTRRLFLTLLALVPLVYAVVQVLFRAVSDAPHASASLPAPSAANLPAMLYMTVHMMLFGVGRTLTGPWAPTLAYPGPALVALGILVLTGLAWAAWAGRPTERRTIAACVILGAGTYGIIAVGRAAGDATTWWVLALFGQAPRYHYAAVVPLLIAGAVGLTVAARQLPTAVTRLAPAAAALWLGALAVGVLRHPVPIDHYDDERRQVATFRARVEDRVRAAPPGQRVRLANGPMYPVNRFTRMNTFPGLAGLFVIFFPANEVEGRRVEFVVRHPGLAAAADARVGTRTAGLLVAPDQAAAR